MASIQTITINGSTYTVEDPNAARIDDSAVGGDAWSSRQILDRFCPAFSQSGGAVSCQPVQDYPLAVVSRIEPVRTGSGEPRPASWKSIYDPKWQQVQNSITTDTLTAGTTYRVYYTPTGGETISSVSVVLDGSGDTVSAQVYDEYCDFTMPVSDSVSITADFDSQPDNVVFDLLQYDPGNSCPLTGHTGVTLRHSGKNLLRLTGRVPVTMNSFDNTLKRECDGNRLFLGLTNNNYHYSNYIKKYTVTDSGVEFTSSSGGYGIGLDVEVKPGQTYSVSFAQQEGMTIHCAFYQADGTYITSKNATGASFSVTAPANARWMMVVCRSQTNIPAVFTNIQVEHSLAATGYEPYRGEELTADLGQTVYGGSFDWEKGMLTMTHGNIAAYEDEEVPQGWISSTGELSQGAQVVYPLAEPVFIQCTPQKVFALPGVNTLSSDTGDTVVTGRLDPLPLLQTLIGEK